MNVVRTTLGSKLYIAAILAALFVVAFYASVSAAEDKPAVVTFEQLEWVEIAPFISMSSVNGDMGTGAHGTVGKFKPNSATPPHTHTGAYHAVVVSGAMTNPFGDEKDPPKLTPGSYWYVPAGAEHVTACVSDTPCVFYFYSDGKFDFIPVAEK
jgi:quercetin dioxygenase-like cupin family protein